ncbi:hypothetical protein ElP_04800 [Tautonia plasticadhaerens]|uniref:Uncharacterized protein n=1 Tax=Tautonia plasticadhaerens TaxID=2527974 RepID=A0A518GVM0_9BACT|nr:hypothetical protein ElP_04800 [Tautonia plasticadhaerens]
MVAVRPDEQCRAVLSLFEGTPWPHPAAALVDWKRSAPAGELRSLGKPLEALIAAFNPLMARELETLDGARVLLDFPPAGGARWAVVVPEDDGSIAALATALALTDGETLPAEGPVRVDRLGPPGAPLIASGAPGVPTVVASDREALVSAIGRGPVGREMDGEDAEPGWVIRVDPGVLADSGSIAARRAGEALIGLGYGGVRGRAALGEGALEVVLRRPRPEGDADARAAAWGAIDPRWLDPVPIDRAAAVVSMAIGPGADAWGEVLGVADRIERADPGRSGVAPLRQRLALLALARGASLEADLWPLLSGVTLWISVDERGDPDGGLVALHATGEWAAARIADRVASRMVGERGGLIPIRLETARRGASVLVGWGRDALASSLSAWDDPPRSAGPMLREAWVGAAPSRVGAAWPGRFPRLGEAGGPLRETLAEGPAVVWLGWSGGGTTRDLVRWDGLDDSVRRFLGRIPAVPTPAGESPIAAGVRP